MAEFALLERPAVRLLQSVNSLGVTDTNNMTR